MKKIKSSRRGLTFTLDKLKIGSKYRYMVDKANHQIIMIPDQEGNITVSKKKRNNGVKPLVDIRSKEVRELVASADYIEVAIQGNKVVVSTYQKEKGKIYRLPNKSTSIYELFGSKTSEIVIPEKMLLVSGMDNYPVSMFGHATLADDRYFEYLCNTPQFKYAGKKPKKADVKKVYDVISLFSGAGMLDKAFLDDRFRFVYGIDFEPAAVETYKANIDSKIICQDIRTVDYDTIPSGDVCIAGSCCQGYSKNNRHNLDSEESEAKRLLVQDFAEIVKAKQPKVWALENVPDMLSKSNGFYLDKIMNILSADYEITSTVVVDCEVGGYSRRKRAIVIGSKIGHIELPKMKVTPYHTVKEALDKVNTEWYNFNDVTVPSEATKEKMSYVPQGGNWENIPKEIFEYGPSTQSNVMRRLKEDEPSITLSNFRKSNILHPTENRIVTVAEASSISGLDKDFKFLGTLSEKQQMVANGVTQAIGKLLRNTLLKALDANEKIVQFAQ